MIRGSVARGHNLKVISDPGAVVEECVVPSMPCILVEGCWKLAAMQMFQTSDMPEAIEGQGTSKLKRTSTRKKKAVDTRDGTSHPKTAVVRQAKLTDDVYILHLSWNFATGNIRHLRNTSRSTEEVSCSRRDNVSFLSGCSKVFWIHFPDFLVVGRSRRRGMDVHASARVGRSHRLRQSEKECPQRMDTTTTQSKTEHLGYG